MSAKTTAAACNCNRCSKDPGQSALLAAQTGVVTDALITHQRRRIGLLIHPAFAHRRARQQVRGDRQGDEQKRDDQQQSPSPAPVRHEHHRAQTQRRQRRVAALVAACWRDSASGSTSTPRPQVPAAARRSPAAGNRAAWRCSWTAPRPAGLQPFSQRSIDQPRPADGRDEADQRESIATSRNTVRPVPSAAAMHSATAAASRMSSATTRSACSGHARCAPWPAARPPACRRPARRVRSRS